MVVCLTIAGLSHPGRTLAAESGCPLTPDADAARLMGRIEDDFRTGARAVQMRIEMSYAPERFRKKWLVRKYYVRQLWGLFDGDFETTRMLYVFTQPPRLAGVTLLFEDVRDPAGSDATWVQLSTLGRFRLQNRDAQRRLVPGTALTYADSRGFIAGDQYDFAFTDFNTEGLGKREASEDPIRTLIACPRSAEIREDLGYSRLEVAVDPVLPIVRQVDYFDLGGKRLKRYTAEGSVAVGAAHFAKRVEMDHFADGIHTVVLYTYYPLAKPPDPEVYRTDEGTQEKPAPDFASRLRGALAAAGLAAELDREAEAFLAEDASLEAEQEARLEVELQRRREASAER